MPVTFCPIMIYFSSDYMSLIKWSTCGKSEMSVFITCSSIIKTFTYFCCCSIHIIVVRKEFRIVHNGWKVE